MTYAIGTEVLEYLQNLNHSGETQISRIPKSVGYITPGSLLFFTYNDDGFLKDRLALVVSNLRGNGIFISTKYNRLISCFRLTDVSPETGAIILRHLHRNRRVHNYYFLTDALQPIFPKDSYRTYNISKIDNLHKVKITKNLLPNFE